MNTDAAKDRLPNMDTSTRLAFDRTRLAFERTLMASIRTATSLITFGFTIYKFFQFEIKREEQPAHHLIGPRGFGLIMIVIGLATLLFSWYEYRRDVHRLREDDPGMARSSIGIIAGFLTLLGIIALLVVVFRG